MPNSLLEKIGSIESELGYNIEYGNKPIDLENMTIAEVLKHQEDKADSPDFDYKQDSTAVGRYQFMATTLKDIVRRNPKDFPKDAKFTPEKQDKAAGILLDRRGYQKYKDGTMEEKDFMKELSKEWASLPDPDTGASYYDEDGLNRSLVSLDEMVVAARNSLLPEPTPEELMRMQQMQAQAMRAPIQ